MEEIIELPNILNNAEYAQFTKKNNQLESPCLCINLEEVKRKFRLFQEALPFSQSYYSIKSNSHPQVIRTLLEQGSFFDTASIFEIRQSLELGVAPKNMHFGNTIKKEDDIREAFSIGVPTYSFDSPEELSKIAKCAPGSKVIVRIKTSGAGASWPLSEKFGTSPTKATRLLQKAKTLKLEPAGISFHVGSQQRDDAAWDEPIKQSAQMCEALKEKGIVIDTLNLGGGFPWHYSESVPSIQEIGKRIQENLSSSGLLDLKIMTEPGRYLVASSGMVKAQVIGLTSRSIDTGTRWVFLDVGIYNGLTESSVIIPKIASDGDYRNTIPSRLGGPTCDSTDIISGGKIYNLPADLKTGDSVYILDAGAYTASHSTTGFNGFPPIKEYFFP